MQLTPAQKTIVLDNTRFKTLCCGRRFGKTTVAIEDMIGRGLANECNQAYIAPTYQQARDIAWEALKKRLVGLKPDINESRLEIKFKNMKGTMSRIVLRGWESIDTLRGQSFHFLVLDEVAMMRNFELNWQEVLMPTLTDTEGGALLISTPKGFNHFYDLCSIVSPYWKNFHYTTYDNPHINPSEIEMAKEGMTEDRFAQEYMADFRKQEGLVYKEFNRHRHIYKEHTIRSVEKIAGVDFGFVNPTAVVHVERDFDNNYWVTNELYKPGMTIEQTAEYTASVGFSKVYPDPANPEAIELMKKKGVNVMEVNKANDSIVTGIQKIRELLKQGRIHIHESCTNLIWEFETYAYPDSKGSRNQSETPLKENDHALDALRYVILTNIPTNNIAVQNRHNSFIRRGRLNTLHRSI